MSDIVTNAGKAAIAYTDALNQAKYTTNALFRQYGFVMPGENGYSIESAQTAFDPNTLFNASTGLVDEANVKALAGQMQIGGKGIMGDITRTGASNEADVAAASRAQGINTGGIMEQRRRLVEDQTSTDLQTAKDQFIAGIAKGMSPIAGAWQDLKTADVTSATNAAGNEAIIASTPTPQPTEVPAGSASNIPPTKAHQYQWWTNPTTGAKFQYVNGKWKKKGR